MTDRICSVDGCEEPHYGKGYCVSHYRFWKKYGDPLKRMRRTRLGPVRDTVAEALADRFEILDSGCWEWQGGRLPQGYGQFSWRGVGKSAHLWSWLVSVGPIPEGLELDHLCRNRGCINPDHLEPVTHAENVRRGKPCKGADHHYGARTHCPKGHPYAGENLRIYSGHRQCRICNRERARAWREAKALMSGFGLRCSA